MNIKIRNLIEKYSKFGDTADVNELMAVLENQDIDNTTLDKYTKNLIKRIKKRTKNFQ